jgi:uridine kinase
MSSSSVLATASLRVRQNADHATLIFLTAAAYSDLFSSNLYVKYSLGDGVFCSSRDRAPIASDSLSLLESRVRSLTSSTSTLEEVRIPRDALFGVFKSHGQLDKIGVLKSIPDRLIKCIRLGSFVDYVLEPMQLDLAQLPPFEFRLYQYGFLLRFPRLLTPDVVGE